MDLNELLNAIKKLHHDADLTKIREAYAFAQQAHVGQVRLSGVPYLDHPLGTAIRLAKMEMDLPTIIAGLLHDVPENTAVTLEEIRQAFGDEVARLVDGVTKLGKIKYRGIERYAENLRKMFVAIAKDVRVIFIKFADRIDNLQSLDPLTPVKQQRIAHESIEIYAPIANRLGMGELRSELEDLAFPYAYSEEYAWLKKIASEPTASKRKIIDRMIREVTKLLEANHVKVVSIHGRVKHFFSLYKKLVRKDRDLNKIYDLVAIRIIVKEVKDCYHLLGLLHSRWRPMPGRIKDYIAQPKPNGYQSLHTTIFSDDGEVVEFQIRTEAMHDFAEFGIAAHWYSKEAGSGKKIPKEHFEWLQRVINLQKECASDESYVENLKITLFRDRIFVFTPKGDVINLPEGATPIDFAYHIHTELGHHAGGAYVNEKIATLATSLKSGDMVQIIEDKNRKGPSEDWLTFVQTKMAREKIQDYFRRQRRLHIFNLFSRKP
ncbi:MAG: RelA/SpoT family protein [Patescibacteria group bacterium]